MTPPAISVIVPVYNTPLPTLETCIGCLRDQTFGDFEAIVIDDGSERNIADGIDALCAEDGRFCVVHTSNRGVSAARNLGVERARGAVVCFADADDYFALWMLEDLWHAYRSDEDIDCVCSYMITTERDDFPFQRTDRSVQTASKAFMEKAALVGNIYSKGESSFLSLGPSAILISAEVAKKNPFKDDIRYMEDTIWNLQRIKRSRGTAVLDEAVYAYKMNPYSATHTFDRDVVDSRIRALGYLSDQVSDDMREWFALRVLANFFACCKCVMCSPGNDGPIKRLQDAGRMSMHPIWDAFRDRGITKNWRRREKIKRRLALSGLLPLAILIKGVKR